MLIGDPIHHSLSPQMHNSGYEALGIDDQYVFVSIQVKPTDIEDFLKGFKAMQNFHSFTCTVPHKVIVMPYLDAVDPVAQEIGAVNVILKEGSKLKGYNTDWLGFTCPLEKRGIPLKGKKVALLGAGGVARSIAYATSAGGGELTVYNRTPEKAQALAIEFGGEFGSLDDLTGIAGADIIVNATSVGMHDKKTLLPKEYLSRDHIIFDVNYPRTHLYQDADAVGAQVIDGREMLLYIGIGIFKYFTGYEGPEAAMRKGLGI